MDRMKTGFVAALLLLSLPRLAWASDLSQPTPLSDRQWERIHSQVSLLDSVAYFPSLLPVIMKHRDEIGLTEQQVAAFRHWRRDNYQQMVDLMNEIIQRRIELSKASLDASIGDQEILDRQKEIFDLQSSLIRLRLSCRRIVMTTFQEEQWNNLRFVLEAYPRLAGLLDP